MKDFNIKDIFYMMLGSILITGFIGYITTGGWGDDESSQPPKPISKHDNRTVTEDVLRLADEKYIREFDIFKEQQKKMKENVYKTIASHKLKDKDEIEQLSKVEPKWLTFEVTAYTSGYQSTGKTPSHPEYGITASGQRVKEGVTIACPKSMKFGTKVKIPYFDTTFTCMDRGSAIVSNRLDVYMKRRSDALAFGRRHLKIQILN